MSILSKMIKGLFASRKRSAKSDLPGHSTVDISEMTVEIYEKFNPIMFIEHEDKKVRYFTPSVSAQWRVNTLFTKEPDTIDWIAGFKSGEILVDIGANVGMYTIWAAVTRGVKVFAFEPESQNYALLNRNIFLNQVSDRVLAYCAALGDETVFSNLYLSQFITGGSCHSFGEEVDFNLVKRPAVFSQGSFSTTLDKLVSDGVVPSPDYIKIDVDGFEHKVVTGMKQTLEKCMPKSVLIEINQHLDEHMIIVEYMQELGYIFSQEQLDVAIRKEGAFKGIGNYVFYR